MNNELTLKDFNRAIRAIKRSSVPISPWLIVPPELAKYLKNLGVKTPKSLMKNRCSCSDLYKIADQIHNNRITQYDLKMASKILEAAINGKPKKRRAKRKKSYKGK
jgi:hypothetical protein